MTRDKFTDLIGRYNGGIEPLESWDTADIVQLIDFADAELQRRAYEREFPPFYVVTE